MSKKSLYAQYKEEIENVYTIEEEYGFSNYKVEINEQDKFEIYIEEIYVVPELRGINKAEKLSDLVVKDAEKRFNNKVTRIYGSVALKANNTNKSLRAMTDFGFKLYSANSEIIYFYKEIKK